MKSYTTTITIRDFLKALFNHKLVFVIVPIAVLAPIYISSLFYTPTFKAKVTLNVKSMKRSSVEYYENLGYYRNPTIDHQELVRSNIVVERVVDALRLYEIPPDYEMKVASPMRVKMLKRRFADYMENFNRLSNEEKKTQLFQMAVGRLKGNISVDSIKDTNMFIITVRDFDPNLAVLQANAVSRSYVIYDLESQIADFQLIYGENHAKVIQLKNYAQDFLGTLNGQLMPDMEAIGPASVKIVAQARQASLDSGQQSNIFLILGFFASITFSIILVFVFEYTDNKFRSPQDVENLLNISVLGTIPKSKSNDLLLGNNLDLNNDTYIVSYRNLSENIFMSFRNKNLKTILITDVEGSQETTYIICNIGTYLAAHHGNKVLIIDANLRTSSISSILGISNSPGIVDVLEGVTELNDAIIEINPDLYVLPSGNTSLNPLVYLESSGMSDLLSRVKKLFGMIIISGPDLLNFTDSVILSSHVDGVSVVINEGNTRRILSQRALAPLIQNNVTIIGIIFNNRTYVIPNFIYKMT